MRRVISYVKRKRSKPGRTEDTLHKLMSFDSAYEKPLSVYTSSESIASSSDTISIYDAGSANKGWTKLHIAAWVGDVQKIRSKLKKVPIDATDDVGRTALHLAASQGHVNAVGFLIACKANATVRDDKGKTALHKAMEFGHQECARLLLDRNISELIHISDLAGDTPLHVATGIGSYDLSLMLLQKGANLEIANAEGQHPLHKACLSNTKDTHELVELLLRYGALINVYDNNNVSPLMLASSQGIIKIVRLFLEYGADKTVKDINGKTAYHYALENKFHDIERVLRPDVGTENKGLSELPLCQEFSDAKKNNLNISKNDSDFADIKLNVKVECKTVASAAGLDDTRKAVTNNEWSRHTSSSLNQNTTLSSSSLDANKNLNSGDHNGQGYIEYFEKSQHSETDKSKEFCGNKNGGGDAETSESDDWSDDFSLPINDSPQRPSLKKSLFYIGDAHSTTTGRIFRNAGKRNELVTSFGDFKNNTIKRNDVVAAAIGIEKNDFELPSTLDNIEIAVVQQGFNDEIRSIPLFDGNEVNVVAAANVAEDGVSQSCDSTLINLSNNNSNTSINQLQDAYDKENVSNRSESDVSSSSFTSVTESMTSSVSTDAKEMTIRNGKLNEDLLQCNDRNNDATDILTSIAELCTSDMVTHAINPDYSIVEENTNGSEKINSAISKLHNDVIERQNVDLTESVIQKEKAIGLQGALDLKIIEEADVDDVVPLKKITIDVYCDNAVLDKDNDSSINLSSDAIDVNNDLFPEETRDPDTQCCMFKTCNQNIKARKFEAVLPMEGNKVLELSGEGDEYAVKHGNIVSGGSSPCRISDSVSDKIPTFFALRKSDRKVSSNDDVERDARNDLSNSDRFDTREGDHRNESECVGDNFEKISVTSNRKQLIVHDDVDYTRIETVQSPLCNEKKELSVLRIDTHHTNKEEKCLDSYKLTNRSKCGSKYVPCWEDPNCSQHNYSPHSHTRDNSVENELNTQLNDQSIVKDRGSWEFNVLADPNESNQCDERAESVESKSLLINHCEAQNLDDNRASVSEDNNRHLIVRLSKDEDDNEKLTQKKNDDDDDDDSSCSCNLPNSKPERLPSVSCNKNDFSTNVNESDTHNLLEHSMAIHSFLNRGPVDLVTEISGRALNHYSSVKMPFQRSEPCKSKTPFSKLIEDFQNFLFMPAEDDIDDRNSLDEKSVHSRLDDDDGTFDQSRKEEFAGEFVHQVRGRDCSKRENRENQEEGASSSSSVFEDHETRNEDYVRSETIVVEESTDSKHDEYDETRSQREVYSVQPETVISSCREEFPLVSVENYDERLLVDLQKFDSSVKRRENNFELKEPPIRKVSDARELEEHSDSKSKSNQDLEVPVNRTKSRFTIERNVDREIERSRLTSRGYAILGKRVARRQSVSIKGRGKKAKSILGNRYVGFRHSRRKNDFKQEEKRTSRINSEFRSDGFHLNDVYASPEVRLERNSDYNSDVANEETTRCINLHLGSSENDLNNELNTKTRISERSPRRMDLLADLSSHDEADDALEKMENRIVTSWSSWPPEISHPGTMGSIGSQVSEEAFTLFHEDYDMAEPSLKKHDIIKVPLMEPSADNENFVRSKKDRLLRILHSEIEILRWQLASKDLYDNAGMLKTVARLQREKCELQATINDLNQSLADRLVELIELRRENRSYERERDALKSKLEAEVREKLNETELADEFLEKIENRSSDGILSGPDGAGYCDESDENVSDGTDGLLVANVVDSCEDLDTSEGERALEKLQIRETSSGESCHVFGSSEERVDEVVNCRSHESMEHVFENDNQSARCKNALARSEIDVHLYVSPALEASVTSSSLHAENSEEDVQLEEYSNTTMKRGSCFLKESSNFRLARSRSIELGYLGSWVSFADASSNRSMRVDEKNAHFDLESLVERTKVVQTEVSMMFDRSLERLTTCGTLILVDIEPALAIVKHDRSVETDHLQMPLCFMETQDSARNEGRSRSTASFRDDFWPMKDVDIASIEKLVSTADSVESKESQLKVLTNESQGEAVTVDTIEGEFDYAEGVNAVFEESKKNSTLVEIDNTISDKATRKITDLPQTRQEIPEESTSITLFELATNRLEKLVMRLDGDNVVADQLPDSLELGISTESVNDESDDFEVNEVERESISMTNEQIYRVDSDEPGNHEENSGTEGKESSVAFLFHNNNIAVLSEKVTESTESLMMEGEAVEVINKPVENQSLVSSITSEVLEANVGGDLKERRKSDNLEEVDVKEDQREESRFSVAQEEIKRTVDEQSSPIFAVLHGSVVDQSRSMVYIGECDEHVTTIDENLDERLKMVVVDVDDVINEKIVEPIPSVGSSAVVKSQLITVRSVPMQSEIDADEKIVNNGGTTCFQLARDSLKGTSNYRGLVKKTNRIAKRLKGAKPTKGSRSMTTTTTGLFGVSAAFKNTRSRLRRKKGPSVRFDSKVKYRAQEMVDTQGLFAVKRTEFIEGARSLSGRFEVGKLESTVGEILDADKFDPTFAGMKLPGSSSCLDHDQWTAVQDMNRTRRISSKNCSICGTVYPMTLFSNNNSSRQVISIGNGPANSRKIVKSVSCPVHSAQKNRDPRVFRTEYKECCSKECDDHVEETRQLATTEAWRSLCDELAKMKSRIFAEEAALEEEKERYRSETRVFVESSERSKDLETLQVSRNEVIRDTSIGLSHSGKHLEAFTPLDPFCCSGDAQKIYSIIEQHATSRSSDHRVTSPVDDNLKGETKSIVKSVGKAATIVTAESDNIFNHEQRSADAVKVTVTSREVVPVECEISTKKFELPGSTRNELGDVRSSFVSSRERIRTGRGEEPNLSKRQGESWKCDSSRLLTWQSSYEKFPVDRDVQLRKLDDAMAKARSSILQSPRSPDDRPMTEILRSLKTREVAEVLPKTKLGSMDRLSEFHCPFPSISQFSVGTSILDDVFNVKSFDDRRSRWSQELKSVWTSDKNVRAERSRSLDLRSVLPVQFTSGSSAIGKERMAKPWFKKISSGSFVSTMNGKLGDSVHVPTIKAYSMSQSGQSETVQIDSSVGSNRRMHDFVISERRRDNIEDRKKIGRISERGTSGRRACSPNRMPMFGY